MKSVATFMIVLIMTLMQQMKLAPPPHAFFFSHIRSLGAAGALAVDICICFHDIES